MEKKWTIRETRKSDAQAIFSIMLIGWLDNYINEDEKVDREFVLRDRLRTLEYEFFRDECRYSYFENTKNNMHFVAEDVNGVIIGFIHGIRNEDIQSLEGLYLYREFHGTGLAQELASRFLEWEDKERNSEVGAVAYNGRAIRFYEKLGFAPNGVTYLLKDKIPCIDLVKKNVGEEK
jgi:RimJ/RimL family protein N-acetyltransferase